MTVERGLMAATEVLIRKGAKVNARIANRQSVLAIAYKGLKRAKKKEDLYARIMACVTMLIDHGAVADPGIEQQWA
jgi:hypothetical protein